MNRIITIGREFGSGGRELGRRLAEELKMEYYDREILSQIVERTSFTEQYIRGVEARLPHPLHPITIGRSFFLPENQNLQQAQAIFREQSLILRELAEKSDAVIVGRCADHILREYHPFRIFVYADVESKVRRCRKRGGDDAGLTEEEIRRQIRRIDRSRAKYYAYHTEKSWGNKENCDLCVNTTEVSIKKLVPVLAQIIPQL